MFNAPLGYEIDDFSPGWDNVAKPSTMQKGGFREIKNFNITRHKGIEKRGGMTKLYGDNPAGSTKITGFYEYKAPDGNTYNLTAIGTTIRAFYEAAWHSLKTGLTADMKYNFATHLGLCYGVNGIDPNFKLHNETPYQVGITPPVAAPNLVKISPGTDAKVEEYAETNQDNCGELRQHADRTQIAQGFKLSEDIELTKVKLSLKKIGTITAGKKVWVEIHSNKTGTQVPGDSATKEANDIATVFTNYELEFTGTKPSLSKNTQYYLVIYGDFDVSSTNFVVAGFDQSAPDYADGKYWEINGSSAWTGHSSIDLVFEIYGITTEGIELVSFGACPTAYSSPIRSGTADYLLAQSFQYSTDSKLTSVKIPLKRVGKLGAQGGYWVEIHKSTAGTSATKNASDNIVGQASDEIARESISTDFTWKEFIFSGTKPELTIISTTVDQDSPASQKILRVASTTGFIAGETVVIGKGTEREETKVIDSISAGAYFTMTEILEYTHTAVQGDAVVNAYYLVLYTDRPVDPESYVEWTNDWSGYEYGREYAISDGFVWTGQAHDHSFEIWGYATGGVIVGEYALDNINIISRGLRETTSQALVAQSLEVTVESTVTRVKLWLSKVGAPTGNIWVEIHDGIAKTDPDKNESTYQVGEASDNVDVASISAFPDYGIDRITDTTIAFVATTKKITDTNNGLAGFLTGDKIRVTGSTNNDGVYTVATGGVAGEIIVEEDLIDEDAGASVSIEKTWVEFTFSGVKPPLVKGKPYYIVLYGDFDVSDENYVAVGMDKIDPQYADGKKWDIASGSPMEWTGFDYIDLIFELYMTVGGLTGRYQHKYCYKRTAFADLISNPSEASDLTEPTAENMRVSLVHSDDPQVNKIILYRTLTIPEGTEDLLFYKAKEFSNEDQDYDDALEDGALTTDLETDNTIPPKAKFITPHKDRVFYANCPDEDDGEQLVRWSKSGKGEACPSLNYQYFDRNDGEPITAIISHRDNVLVFKRNKIGVFAGNLSQPLSCEISYLSLGIGCIASWALLPLEDKVLFLSEEGWKATDGTYIHNISSKINGLIEDGYITINQNENYSVAYYPKNEQFQFLINHSTLEPMVTVGHFLIPLMLASKGIIGISEKVLGDLVGWTYHQYDYHTPTCLGNYTDANGITRVIAGSDDGYVYLLDSGLSDDGSNIHTKLRTDWLALERPKSHTKITRRGYLGYCVSGTISLEIQEDIDFAVGGSPAILTGSARGIDDALRESFGLAGTGELFRYTLSEFSSQALAINEFSIMFRDIGAR